jgi:eukaryotic-like serine/threonine-protein kinase
MSDLAQKSPVSERTLLCPRCGAPEQVAGSFCRSCGRVIVRVPEWAGPLRGRRRLFTGRRVALLGILLAFLGFVLWLNFPFIPDPVILLFKRPTTNLTSAAQPNQWPSSGGGISQTRHVDAPRRLLLGQVRWSKDLGPPTRSAPIIVDGVIYIGGHFKIMALEAGTGRPLWEKDTSGQVNSSLAAAGGNLYLGLLDHRLIALDAQTGEFHWEFMTQDIVTASPVIARGIVYVGSWDGFIYALDAATGELIWQHEAHNSVRPPVAVQEGMLFAADDSGNLYILNARTGQERLMFRTPGSGTASPVAAKEMVYFPSGGRVYAVDAHTKEIPGQYLLKQVWAQFWIWQVPGVPRPPGQQGGLWRFSPEDPERGIIAAPALTPEALYVGDIQGNFYAQDALSGEELWRFQVRGGIVTSPVVVGDVVYFGSSEGLLYALDRFTGETIWQLSLESPIEASPVFAGGYLYVRTADGLLHAIE